MPETILTIRLNGVETPLTAPTLASLVAEHTSSPDARGIAAALNGAVVRRADWAAITLKSGDKVEIVLARQGG
jgi:sulfur carrier protein